MFSDFGYSEEKSLGKPYDITLLKRLFPYAMPYRASLSCAVFLVIIITILDLAMPYVIKIAIDTYIVPPVPDPVNNIKGVSLAAAGFLIIIVLNFVLNFFDPVPVIKPRQRSYRRTAIFKRLARRLCNILHRHRLELLHNLVVLEKTVKEQRRHGVADHAR